MKFVKSLLFIAPIVADLCGGIPSIGVLAEATTREESNGRRLLDEGRAGIYMTKRMHFANSEGAISATNGRTGSATLRGRNKHRRQLGEGMAVPEAKERGLKGGVPFAKSAGVIGRTFKTSAIAILSSPHLVAFANSGVRGDVVPNGGEGKKSSISKANNEGKGIVAHTKHPLSIDNINIAKKNPAASLGDAFTETALASDKGLNDKTNRHLEGTCGNEAFLALADLKLAVNAYIGDSGCVTDSTSCNVDGKYGWPMNTWCVGAVRSLRQLFYEKPSFNEDISSWDTGQVTDMYYMFHDAIAFNQDIGNWNVDRVNNMQAVFYSAHAFNQDIGSWNVDSVDTMHSMFTDAIAFNQDIGSWNVDRVMNMKYMFNTATAFNQELCAWGQYDYISSGDIYELMFERTDCVNKGQPTSLNGPWCSITTQSQCPALLSSTPTSNPTGMPTSAAPWEIHFLTLSADFSVNSSDEVLLTYDIGKDREHESLLFMKDCVSNVTDITVNYTEPMLTLKTATLNTLSLGYSIDKSMIANSTIWNATSSQIELCQVVQLKEGAMVIVEDIRQVTIDFDLLVDYEINNSSLGAATINAGNDTANVASYIESCKCDGVSFVCNADALVPSKDLIVCIKSISPDVKIDFLDSLIVSQEGTSPLAFIDNNAVVFPTFTSREYVTTKNGVVAFTRVPINLFDYNSPESSIAITGKIVLKLTDSGRKLKADIGSKFDVSEEASFDIEVDLQREIMFEDETSMNSAVSVASSKATIAYAMVLAWTYAMW